MSNIVSATGLKNKVSEVLNNAYFKGKVTIVERYGKPIAKIVPAEEVSEKIDIKSAIKATFGIMPDFPDVTKDRKSRKKKLVLNS